MVRTEGQIQRDVAKGAALLDKYSKNWVKTFVEAGSEAGFDIGDGAHCVLGNTFKKFADNREWNGWSAGKAELGLNHDQAMRHGFNISEDEEYDGQSRLSWQWLTEAWQFEILVRLSKKSTPTFRGLLSDATRIFRKAITSLEAAA